MPDIGRIYQLLNIVKKHAKEGITNKEISLEAGLPAPTTFRILESLAEYYFVSKREFRYYLGPAHLRFAQTFFTKYTEIRVCHKLMDELYDKINETVYYSIFLGDYCIVLAIRGFDNLTISVGLGEQMPFHCSAAGKAVLAFIPIYKRYTMYNTMTFDKYTEKTITDADLLETHLPQITETKIAYEFDEFHEGINAFAVPIFNTFGMVDGSITVIGSSSSLTEKVMKEKSSLLIKASKEISKKVFSEEFN